MRVFRLGSVLLCAALGCGPRPSTTVLVTVAFDETRLDTRQLLFEGRVAEAVVFVAQRPELPSAERLSSPQTLRVWLDDSLGGASLQLYVGALSPGQALVAEGRDSIVVATGVEQFAAVALGPIGDLEQNGAYDGGAVVLPLPDGGSGAGGGSACDCSSGCCNPGLSTCASPALKVLSDAEPGRALNFVPASSAGAGRTCDHLCDPQRSSRFDGVCRCGAGPACGLGQRCAPTGSGASTNPLSWSCICDEHSACSGCCRSGQCVQAPEQNSSLCGGGGHSCESCSNAGTCNPTGVCANSSKCSECTESDKCCTAGKCVDAEFPRCRLPSNRQCLACDPLRADRCSSQGCACGSKAPCAMGTRCLGGSCVAVF